MQQLRRRLNDGSVVTIGFTTTADGDFSVTSDGVNGRRAAIDPRPWTWLHQVHGANVVRVTQPGGGAGETADASVTIVEGTVLAAQGADCAPIAFWTPEGPCGIAHAGWKGIEAGIVDATASALRDLGASAVHAIVGPVIGPLNYEFGEDDLARLSATFGETIRGTTSAGTGALDVAKMLSSAMRRSCVTLDHNVCVDTSGSLLHYSHRTRRDAMRHCGWIVRS